MSKTSEETGREINIKSATERACKEPTLVDAISWICVWESERAIEQAVRYKESNQRTPDGAGWETCFKHCIQSVLDSFPTPETGGEKCPTCHDNKVIPINNGAEIIRYDDCPDCLPKEGGGDD